MPASRSKRYIEKIGEAFEWAKREEYMASNPASGVAKRERRVMRHQDARDALSDDVLRLIFGHDWFKAGKGALNANGVYSQFRPHYYWLPLLGLYTGARINELSQLYLKDIACTSAGQWYLDFNLSGDGKADIDARDKQLKNVNATRKVPLHPELLGLGFVEYQAALAANGHTRLFPELRHDPIKGYGKQASQWFNERFMGRLLRLPRDGKQVIHSFRHNFLTAMDRAGANARVRNVLAGHATGEGVGGQGAVKDESPDELSGN